MDDLRSLVSLGKRLSTEKDFGITLANEWLRVQDKTGRIVPLNANAVQRSYEANRSQRNIVLKARQMGMTTWVAGQFFLRTITTPGILTVLVAQTRTAAEAIYSIVERMWQYLPQDLREGPLVRSRANVGQMVFPLLGSEFRAWSAADTNAGRGLSIQHLHCSELGRWTGDASATLAGLRAALAPQGELVLESTPNGAYGAFYEEWSNGIEHASHAKESSEERVNIIEDPLLTRHFFPWWMEPGYTAAPVVKSTLTDEEQQLIKQHGLSTKQIGFRRSLEQNFRGLRQQEFAEDPQTCFRATGSCCFDVDAVEHRMMHLPPPLSSRLGGSLLQWLPPAQGRYYIVAVDPAGGGSNGDFTALQVIDRATGMQCAELQERLTPAETSAQAASLAREYNNALIVVERNNMGPAVLAYLETRERYENIFRQRNIPGWLTSTVSKPEMIARLGLLLTEEPERFMSRRFLGECRTFINTDGRSAASPGAHDDLVMSMAIAQMILIAP